MLGEAGLEVLIGKEDGWGKKLEENELGRRARRIEGKGEGGQDKGRMLKW